MAPLSAAFVLACLAAQSLLVSGRFIYESKLADFEDLPADLLGVTSLVPPPVPYRDLNFQNVIVASNAPLQLLTLNTTQGEQYVATNPGQYPAVTTNYPGSKVVSFNLFGLYTGCYLSTANGNAVPPVDCTLRFTGNKATGPPVTQDFSFINPVAVAGVSIRTESLRQITFSAAFSDLVSLDVLPIVSAGTPALTGVDLDDVSYRVKKLP